VASDFSVDADNTWTNPAVVDAHVHAGWTEDYLYKQVSWNGVDNLRSTITTAVHSGLVNNAFFASPPFGADGRGMFVFGRASSGAPMTALDVVAHEMMHGVTRAALTQRTGNGLFDVLFLTLGPTTMTSGGTTFACDTTEAIFSDGTRLPMLCTGGRYTLASNHGGAINEAFSDIFGIATEFFHQPPGNGPLQADYKLGEDLAGFGPNRAADVPASLIAMPSSAGTIPYPDHASRTFSYLLAISQGTRANPLAITPLPWTLQGSQLVTLPSSDSGGVHVNATVLSHAFYLAIEGGRNATSGINVTGVGAADSAQKQRALIPPQKGSNRARLLPRHDGADAKYRVDDNRRRSRRSGCHRSVRREQRSRLGHSPGHAGGWTAAVANSRASTLSARRRSRRAASLRRRCTDQSARVRFRPWSSNAPSDCVRAPDRRSSFRRSSHPRPCDPASPLPPRSGLAGRRKG
jgi:hypothetical protein